MFGANVRFIFHSPIIVRFIVLLFLGPSCSIRNIDCHVPRFIFPFCIGIVSVVGSIRLSKCDFALLSIVS